METVYEVWIKRAFKEIVEDVVVTDKKTKEQRVEKKKTRQQGEVFEAVTDGAGAPVQYKTQDEATQAAAHPLTEEGVERVFVREIATISELVKPEAAPAK